MLLLPLTNTILILICFKNGTEREYIENKYLILTKGDRLDVKIIINVGKAIKFYKRQHIGFVEYLILLYIKKEKVS